MESHLKKINKPPVAISRATKMIYISVALGLVNPSITEFTTDQSIVSNPVILGIILFISALFVLLGYQIGLGKKWPRTILVIIFLLSLIPFPGIMRDSFDVGVFVGVISLAQMLLIGYAVYLLFTKGAREWYSRESG